MKGRSFRISLNKRKVLRAGKWLESDSAFSAKLLVLYLVRNPANASLNTYPLANVTYLRSPIFFSPTSGRCSISSCSTFVQLCANLLQRLFPRKFPSAHVFSRMNFRKFEDRDLVEASPSDGRGERLLKILNGCHANGWKCSREKRASSKSSSKSGGFRENHLV